MKTVPLGPSQREAPLRTRNKIVAIASIILVLVVASFFVGGFYYYATQYSQRGAFGPLAPVPGAAPVTLVTTVASQTTMSATVGAGAVAQERMVIYNGQISLETSHIEDTLAKIRALAESYGGYVAGSSRSNYGTQATAEITIRIPKDKFRTAVREIETYGKLLGENTSSEDVTQQYIDLKARLDNLQKQEQRLREILTMATTVDDILKVEDELTRVRGDIESLQGQINYLENNVEMSLISVSLVEPAPPFTPPGMNWGETFQTAIMGLFIVLRGLIIIAVSLIPIAIIGVPAYYLYRRRKRKEKK
jgi:hypothetical protein